VSSPGRQQRSSDHQRSDGDHHNRRAHKPQAHEKKSAPTPAEDKRSKGIKGKVANFFRGGMRATFGRIMKGKGEDATHASHKAHSSHSSKSAGAQRHAAPASKLGSQSRHPSHPPRPHANTHTHEPALPPADCRWIADEPSLKTFLNEIRGPIESGSVLRSFIDTEADSLHHYSEKLCLIQLAVDGHFALIDPLALPDLSELLVLLDKTEIWLHGADYDLTLLKRTYDWSPHRICDTQIGARLCGQRPFGLAALVERHCGIVLCKSSQKADWSQRPLPAKMQAYAVDDVRYLGRIADILVRELTEKGRLDWFTQSCATLRRDVLKRPDRDKEDAWRINGSGRLKPAGLAVLRELWQWRDATAASRDVPSFKVLNNQQLLGMAVEFESTGHAPHPPRWRQEWRDGFRAAVTRAQDADPSTWPQQPRQKRRHITEAQKDRIEKLCIARDKKAEALGIESSLLGSRATLEQVVLQPPAEAATILMPWQSEVLGAGFSRSPDAASTLPPPPATQPELFGEL
jgi:ribonuclease D